MKRSTANALDSTPRLGVMFSSLMLVVLLAALDQTIVSTALPTITGDLGGVAYIAWVVTGYLLATTVVTPFYGKLGDMYGRKLMLQVGIALFLTGSVLSGLAQNMGQLIAFRAVQGLGGGGLIVTAMAVVAELVPPRERGRYQGIFGAVFAFATLAGPLLGGFVVDHLSWRWIFFINVPLGVAAIVIVGLVFRTAPKRQRQTIDYTGALLLTGALSATVLFASTGGAVLPWNSLPVIGLGLAAFALTLAFIAAESRARSPILPLHLFAEPVFAVAATMSLIMGMAMFGSITYIPLYLQIVQGASPSVSGLLLAPLMGGVVITSTLSGHLISRLGRYRPFPIAGTALMTLGLYLLSRLPAAAPVWTAPAYLLVLGLGMGMVMQVLVLAVQNAVDFHHLGVATSGNAMFRQIGGAIGVSLFSAIFSAQLAGALAHLTAPDFQLPATADPATIATLPIKVRDAYAQAVADALQPVFLAASWLAAVAFLLSWRLHELPLSKAVAASALGATVPMPRDASSLSELEHIVDTLSRRENSWYVYRQLGADAGIRLPPPALWLLARLAERAPIAADAVAKELGQERAAIVEPLALLRGRRLVRQRQGTITLTRHGRQALYRLRQARKKRLVELLRGWHPEQHDAVTALIEQLAHSLVRKMPKLP